MKRVLIVVENLPVPFDRRVWMEATTLCEAGYQVSVICPTGKGYERRFEILDGIYIYRHPLEEATNERIGFLSEYMRALGWEMRIARRVWRERGFDLVHICNPPDLLFLLAGWYKLFYGVRVIFDHHDLSPELYEVKYGRRDIFYRALLLAERLTFRTADLVISTNESYRQVALERGGKSPNDVHVVRSAPDLARFSRVASVHEAEDPMIVGYLGVMAEQDGVDRLLRAAHHLVKVDGRTDLRFVLVGGGPQIAALRHLCSRLELNAFVEFPGYLSGRELLTCVSRFDIGVCPDPKNSYNDRCTMNKVLEYMALGIPLVQFDLTEGRRSAGDASLYARPNDPIDLAAKIASLADEDAERRRKGAIGRKRMEDCLEWRHQVPNLLAAYRAALGKSLEAP